MAFVGRLVVSASSGRALQYTGHPATGRNHMLAKVLVVVIFLGILASMASALVFMVKDKGQSDRTVKALTVRISVSIALFALLFVLWGLGLITPHGVQP